MIFVAWRLGLYVLHCIRIFMLHFPLKLFHNYQCILITAFKINYSAVTTKAPKHIINTSLLALKGYYNLFLLIQTLEKQVRSDNWSILQVLSYISTETTNVTAAWVSLRATSATSDTPVIARCSSALSQCPGVCLELGDVV